MYTIEEKSSGQRTIAIELDVDVVDARIDEVVRRVRRKVQLPGFRKGKVPVDVVEKRYWDSIQQEVLQSIVPEAINEVVEEEELRIAAQPRVEELHFERGEPLKFTALVELWPEIELPDLASIEIDEELFELEEDDIDKGLEELRNQAAKLEPTLEPSEVGDLVEAHIYPADHSGQRLPKGKRRELQLDAGAPNLLPEFREATVGLSVNEEKLIEVQYPDEHRDRDLAGGRRFFILRANRVQKRIRPELDDSFAAEVEEGLDMSGLREKVREQLVEQEAKRARQMSEAKFISRIVDTVPFDIPEGVIEEGISRGMTRAAQQNPGGDPEQVRAEVRTQVVVMWKRRLILDAIARKESLSVSDEEIDARIRERLGESVNVPRVRQQLSKSGEINGLALEVLDEKVFEKVFEEVEVKQSTQPRPKEQTDSNIIIP